MNFKDFIDFRFRQIYKTVIDLLFPIECLGCGKEGEWLCDLCWQQIHLSESYNCPICKKKLTGGQVCLDCHAKSFLDGVLVAAHYDDKIIDRLVHCLKYKGIKDLASPMSKLLIKMLQQVRFWETSWSVVPVPLHKFRERFRGFNQSELLARQVAKELDLSIDNQLLKRVRYTYPQMKLRRIDRLKNIKNAFVVNQLTTKKIILIDDVMTSGSTLQECAKVLKISGATEVWAVVLARGV